jgi:hypothetical protein
MFEYNGHNPQVEESAATIVLIPGGQGPTLTEVNVA